MTDALTPEVLAATRERDELSERCDRMMKIIEAERCTSRDERARRNAYAEVAQRRNDEIAELKAENTRLQEVLRLLWEWDPVGDAHHATGCDFGDGLGQCNCPGPEVVEVLGGREK